jgi:acyl-CoA dehydrogenase
MLISKEFGGKGFSRLAISTVMHTLTPYSFTVGTLVMIPNSLGAAELILVYGTAEQKQAYLPKLANGEYVPCFGLTEQTAGSDAASIKARGEVFKDSDGEIKIKLNFRKRYITLAPIANLATIACRLFDPQNLLGKTPGEDKEVGITCVLLHKGTPGFTNGDHHRPIGETFDNGPLIGKDVVVPLGNIIGGPDYAGMGWRMLMEQLAGGRSISLPAGAIGNMKLAMAATGAYSMVRQQFNREIGLMEGVEQKIAFIAAMTYMCEAARVYACSAIDNDIEPPVTSAVLKAYTTDLARQAVTAGMDVFAGAAVMQGPKNILGKIYTSAPVGITVEGANILTRTLMIFGQGSTRCHPYAQNVVNAVENEDVPTFRRNILGWLGHFILGGMRTITRSATRGLTVSVPAVAPGTKSYYRRLGWAAAHFGTLTDLALVTIGGKLKARGALTGRYADAVAYMLLGFAALRRFEAEGRLEEDRPLLEFAVEYSLHQVQVAFEAIYDDFDVPVIGWLMAKFGSPLVRLNRLGHQPSARASHRAAATVQSYGEQFNRLTHGLFVPAESALGLGQLLQAFRLSTETAPLVERIVKAQKNRELPRGYVPAEIADQAVTAGLITSQEASRLQEAHEARKQATDVDVVTAEQYYVKAS